MEGRGCMSGFIKLYRTIQDSFVWEEKPFAYGQAWIDLIMMANHENKKFLLGSQMIEAKRGEVITSQDKLCKRWGWGNTRLRSFLKLLQNEKMIMLSVTQKQTAIEIVNYDVYQITQIENKQIPNRQFDTFFQTDKKNIKKSTRKQIASEPDISSVASDTQIENKFLPNRYQIDTKLLPNTNKELLKELKEEEKEIYKEKEAVVPSEQYPLSDIPYKEIIEYLNGKIRSNFKANTRSYQRLINGRWNEGFRLKDFQTVIDNKVAEWYGDPKMQKYLRPETLFRATHFQSYLNQKIVPRIQPSAFEPSDEMKEVPWT